MIFERVSRAYYLCCPNVMNTARASPVRGGLIYGLLKGYKEMTPGDSYDPLAELKAALGEGNPELVAGLMDLFLEDTPGKLEVIHSALANMDSAALFSAAHDLKLSALTMEVRIMAGLAEQLEELGRQSLWEGTEFLARRIEDEFIGLCRRLHVSLEDIPFTPIRRMKIGYRKRFCQIPSNRELP